MLLGMLFPSGAGRHWMRLVAQHSAAMQGMEFFAHFCPALPWGCLEPKLNEHCGRPQHNQARCPPPAARALQNSLAAITRMEGELEAASAKYVQVQGLKAYVADLCSMLQASSRWPAAAALRVVHGPGEHVGQVPCC